MNTSLLITSTWIISFSLTLYLVRKRQKKTSIEQEHSMAQKLWENTHTFSDWASAKNVRKKARLLLVKK